jgi:hypothetical protein
MPSPVIVSLIWTAVGFVGECLDCVRFLGVGWRGESRVEARCRFRDGVLVLASRGERVGSRIGGASLIKLPSSELSSSSRSLSEGGSA